VDVVVAEELDAEDAALVAAGFNVTTQIPCMTQIQVGGRTFTNSPHESGLGTQPSFGTDFARACGTAFAGLSLDNPQPTD